MTDIREKVARSIYDAIVNSWDYPLTTTPESCANAAVDAVLSAIGHQEMVEENERLRTALAEEREQCARIAETCAGDFQRDTPGRTEGQTRVGIASAIRARGSSALPPTIKTNGDEE